jgi:hypothetical protein
LIHVRYVTGKHVALTSARVSHARPKAAKSAANLTGGACTTAHSSNNDGGVRFANIAVVKKERAVCHLTALLLGASAHSAIKAAAGRSAVSSCSPRTQR